MLGWFFFALPHAGTTEAAEEVDVAVGSLLSLLEPFMVVVLGGIVGTIVLALFMPLVEMIEKVGKGGGK